jgi:hypothetical protein
MTALQTTAKDLTKWSREGGQDSTTNLKAVEGMITRVENLKRKASMMFPAHRILFRQ